MIRFALIFIVLNSCLWANKLVLEDAETGKKLVSASLYIKSLEGPSKDSVYSKLTKLNKFTIPFNGRIYLGIKHFNYESYSDTIDVKQIIRIRLKPKHYVLEEVVATGQIGKRSSQESVFNVKTIDSEIIEAQASPTLRELLMNNSNTRINNDGVLGSSISINGVSGRNVKIMIDGVPLVGREDGNIDLSQIILNDAERVEIVEGPMSAIYGSDALGGVINVITKSSNKSEMSAKVNTYYESVGFSNLNTNLFISNGSWNFFLNGGRNFFGGWSENEEGRSQQWNPKIQLFGDLKVVKRFKNSDLTFNTRLLDEYILNRFDAIKPYGERAFDDDYETERYVNNLFWKGEISKNRFFDLSFSHQYYERNRTKYLKDLITLDRIKTAFPSDHQTSIFNNYRFRGTYSFDNLNKALSYQFGYDFNLDRATGDRIIGFKNIDDYALFMTGEYTPFKSLKIQPMLRAMYNTQFDAPLVPSLNIKYTINNLLTYRLGVATGFRAPSIKELYLEFIDSNHDIFGNENLKSENSININTNLNYVNGNAGNIVKFDIKGFYNDINNQIQLSQIGIDPDTRLQEFQYINVGKFRSIGFDVGLQYFRENVNLLINFNYTGRYNRIEETATLEDFSWWDELRTSPELQTNFTYSSNSPDFWYLDFNVFYKYTGRLPFFQFVDGQLEQTMIDAFHTLDVNVSRSFLNNMLKVRVGGKNLFNVTNVNAGSGGGGAHSGGGPRPVAWGRTLMIGVDFNVN